MNSENSEIKTVVINGKSLSLTAELAAMVVPAWPLMASLTIGETPVGHRCAQKSIGLRIVAADAEKRTIILENEVDGRTSSVQKLAINSKIFLSDYANQVRLYFDLGSMTLDASVFGPQGLKNTKLKTASYPLEAGMFIEHRADGLVRIAGQELKAPVNGEGMPIICDLRQYHNKQAVKYAGYAEIDQEQALASWAQHLGLELKDLTPKPSPEKERAPPKKRSSRAKAQADRIAESLLLVTEPAPALEAL